MARIDSGTIGYIQTVEQLFVLLRRQGLMLSPLDAALAADWAEAGIPLHIACAAIVDAIEHLKSVDGEGRTPHTLRYFAPIVEEAAKTHAANTLRGEDEGKEEPVEIPHRTVLDRLIDELVLIGGSEQDLRVRDAYRDLYAGLETLRNVPDPARSPIAALISLDESLFEDVWRRLDPSERDAVESSIDEKLAGDSARLGVRGEEEKRRALWEEELVNRFQLFRPWRPGRSPA